MSFVLAVNIRIELQRVDAFMNGGARERAHEEGAGMPAVRGAGGPRGSHFKKYLAEAVPLLASRERQVLRRAEEHP